MVWMLSHYLECNFILYFFQAFDLDTKTIAWDEYVQKYCLGLKEYVLKEDLSKLDIARDNIRR